MISLISSYLPYNYGYSNSKFHNKNVGYRNLSIAKKIAFKRWFVAAGSMIAANESYKNINNDFNEFVVKYANFYRVILYRQGLDNIDNAEDKLFEGVLNITKERVKEIISNAQKWGKTVVKTCDYEEARRIRNRLQVRRFVVDIEEA